MSADDPNLFSELQLSQLATMMPHLISKAKIESHAQAVDAPQAPEVRAVGQTNEQDSLLKNETQKGLLRLAEFLKKQKPAPMAEEKVVENKIIPFKKIAPQNRNIHLTAYVSRRGFETYEWVRNAYDTSDFLAVQLNKYF